MIEKSRGRERWKTEVHAQLFVPVRAKSEHLAKHGSLLNEAWSGANQHGAIHPPATTLCPSASCACSSPPSTCIACPQPGSDPQSCSPASCLPCSTMSSSPAPLSSHCRIRTAVSQGGDLPQPSSRSDNHESCFKLEPVCRHRAPTLPLYHPCALLLGHVPPVWARSCVTLCVLCAGAEVCVGST